MEHNTENLILSPEEVEKRRETKRRREPVKQDLENEDLFLKEDVTPLVDKSATVKIDYESQGRFGTPETLYFKDYSLPDVNKLILSRREDLIENLLIILNKNKIEVDGGSNFDVSNFTLEDIYETLIAIKKSWNSPIHKHSWLCKCQYDKEDADKQFNIAEIDLRTLQFQSLSQAEENLRDYYRSEFKTMSSEEWREYLETKYKGRDIDLSNITIEDELKTITIKEPIKYVSNGHTYLFRMSRIGDVVRAQKKLNQKYNHLIKRIQDRREHGVGLAQLKEKKEQEIKKLEQDKDNDMVLYIKAYSLYSVDGKILSDDEKVEIFNDDKYLTRRDIMNISYLLEKIQYGVVDEREVICPLCGRSSKESLRDNLDFFSLLPFDNDSDDDARKLTRANFSFGV